MTSSREHPLFQQYPLNEQVQLSTGTVPTPYHIYNGHATFIGGTSNLVGTSTLLSGQRVAPVQTANSRALMGLWIVEGTDASLGKHQELQVSFFVTRKPIPPVNPHPFAILNLLLTKPVVKMMAHGLWNDTVTAVAYNREHLGLDARLMRGEIHREPKRKRFAFYNAQTGAPLLKGKVFKARRPSVNVILPAIKAFGLGNFLKSLALPTLTAGVVNPITDALPHNHVASTFTKNDTMSLQFFDPTTDTLEFGEGPYQELDFQPEFVEHMDGFKFVYLNPQPWK